MIKDYGPIFGGFEDSKMIITPGTKYFFAANSKGHVKQISLEIQQVVRDYGKIHDGRVARLGTTRDSKWLITVGWFVRPAHQENLSREQRS
jgi:hypothetical protein